MSEELIKSVDDLVNQTLANLETPEVEAPAEVIVKSDAAPEDQAEDKKEPKAEAKDDKKPVEKDAKDEKKSVDKDAKDEKKEDKKPAFMKKSMEELALVLSSDELEVINAWREELASEESVIEETIVKSAAPAEDLSKAFTAELEEIRKSIAVKDDLIKSLSERVEKLAAQPAHAPKGISDLTVIEKSQEAATLSKAQISDALFDLQKAGQATSKDVIEFEMRNTISNPQVRELVANACMKS